MKLIFSIILILFIFITIIKQDAIIENFTSKKPKIGIVSTVRNPHQINDWLRYHYNFGISKIFLIFDNPYESFENHFGSKLQIFLNDDNWKKNLKKCPQYESMKYTFDSEVMTRQILNIEYVLKYCINDEISWLIHIDCDEILYSSKYDDISEVITNLNSETNVIKINNFELAPVQNNALNCFRTHVYFKTRKNGKKFVAYYNGKSGCKVERDIFPHGVHEFNKNYGLKREVIPENELVVLHYVNCNFIEWKNKYKILGDFKDKWWGNVNIPFHLHKKSRDVINTIENDSYLKKIYNSEMLVNNHVIENLIKEGKITKINKVRKKLCEKV